MNETVTSVSKKEEKLSDAAAAIFVLTNDDLRRSGTTTVADALRLVPGLQVAAIDSANWAISARGFNNPFANKLLVMIDGRSVYSPLFSGVYWDVQQVLFDDVDRIEVIRGPGATIWGANAVNGVISIIRKSARDTQGSLIYGGGGDVHESLGGVRYGGPAGKDTWYRVYAAYQSNDDFRQANGQSARDSWDLLNGGFRLDRYTSTDGQLTWQGNIFSGNLADRTGDQAGFSTLGRWMQHGAGRSGAEIQVYFDHTYRNDGLAAISLNTADLTFQQTFGLGESHDIIWGLGYRYTETRFHRFNIPGSTIVDPNVPLNLFSAFVQDELTIIPNKLVFTLGTKIEHNDFTGLELQPGARLMFKVTEKQTAWASVARAVRTPSEADGIKFGNFALGAPITGPDGGLYLPTLVGNTQLGSEVLWAYELGYRIQPTHRVSVDMAAFYNDYRRLVGRSPTAFLPGVPLGILAFESANTLRAQTSGAEVTGTVAVSGHWRLSASYSFLIVRAQGAPANEIAGLESNAPTHQVVLRSSYDFTRQASLDGAVRYVDNVQGVAAYTTADLRWSWRPTDQLELSLVGQNLLDRSHPEQASTFALPTVEVPRSGYGKVTWRF